MRPGESFAATEPKSKPYMLGRIRRCLHAPLLLELAPVCVCSERGRHSDTSVTSLVASVDRSAAPNPLLLSWAEELERCVSVHRSELTSDGSTA